MRKLILPVAVVALLAAALVVVAALSLNRIIARNHEQILQRAAATVGRAVVVDSISVSLWGGLGGRLDNLRIADDPRFDTQDFVRAESLTAQAKLWPLLRGQFEVGRIDARRPQIHLVRNASGQWNYETLGRDPASAPSTPAAATGHAGRQPEASGALPLLIARANITDGRLLVTDHRQTPPSTTQATDIDLALSDVSDNTSVQFRLDAALDADAQNIHLDGRVGPLANRAAVPIEINGSVGPLRPRMVRLDEVHLQAVAAPDSVRVSRLDGRAFDGSFALTGQYVLRDGAAVLKGQVKDVNVGKLLQVFFEGGNRQTEGTGQLTLDLRAPGTSADALRAAAGDVAAEVQSGVIHDFNLVDELLAQVSGVAGIGTVISANVKHKYAALFSEPATRFETLRGTFHVADGRIHTDDLAIIATDYGLGVSGWVGLDRNADLALRLVMSKQFSADVTADVKEAKYLLDEHEQLALPFRVRGRIGEAKPEPDSAYLAHLLQRAVTHGGARDLLDKLLGGKRGTAPTPGANEPGELLEQGLRNLLGR